jgi:glycosyltransferase involved in cell wall biosynthesis
VLVSVVINTFNRAGMLAATLDALRRQDGPEFEVVVVNGPSDDGTGALLAARAGDLRVVDCPERHLSRSRNLGIDAAAGDVVAFVDDDAIPEPSWLAELAAAYDDPAIAGAGGVVLDRNGVLPQYRFSACDRLGAAA